MSTSAEGGGTANDAKVATVDNYGLTEEQLRDLLSRNGVVLQPSAEELADIEVANAEAKVRKQKAHLDGAREALSNAKAARAALKKEG